MPKGQYLASILGSFLSEDRLVSIVGSPVLRWLIYLVTFPVWFNFVTEDKATTRQKMTWNFSTFCFGLVWFEGRPVIAVP